jgi:ubiquinone/menaquinone biosynthesis C-methylase UbiE
VSRRLWLARQARLPQGLLGEVVALAMSYDTARVNRAAIGHLELAPRDAVLEVGFGSGRALLEAAARVRDGFIAGVDPSEVMLRHARFRNARYLRSGLMELQLGEAARLPYPDARFDKAFGVHVIYFWPEPEPELRELHRVLRPGGRLLLGFRPKDDPAVVARTHPEVFELRTAAEVAKLLEESSFAVLRSTREVDRGRSMSWVLAQRSAPAA